MKLLTPEKVNRIDKKEEKIIRARIESLTREQDFEISERYRVKRECQEDIERELKLTEEFKKAQQAKREALKLEVDKATEFRNTVLKDILLPVDELRKEAQDKLSSVLERENKSKLLAEELEATKNFLLESTIKVEKKQKENESYEEELIAREAKLRPQENRIFNLNKELEERIKEFETTSKEKEIELMQRFSLCDKRDREVEIKKAENLKRQKELTDKLYEVGEREKKINLLKDEIDNDKKSLLESKLKLDKDKKDNKSYEKALVNRDSVIRLEETKIFNLSKKLEDKIRACDERSKKIEIKEAEILRKQEELDNKISETLKLESKYKVLLTEFESKFKEKDEELSKRENEINNNKRYLSELSLEIDKKKAENSIYEEKLVIRENKIRPEEDKILSEKKKLEEDKKSFMEECLKKDIEFKKESKELSDRRRTLDIMKADVMKKRKENEDEDRNLKSRYKALEHAEREIKAKQNGKR